ncbi:MAG: hypothetical protein ACRD0O_01750 [Acidimicrobiia bacterium]
MQGTSYAAPIVAGVAMLARARFPGENADQIIERVRRGARDAGPWESTTTTATASSTPWAPSADLHQHRGPRPATVCFTNRTTPRTGPRPLRRARPGSSPPRATSTGSSTTSPPPGGSPSPSSRPPPAAPAGWTPWSSSTGPACGSCSAPTRPSRAARKTSPPASGRAATTCG